MKTTKLDFEQFKQACEEWKNGLGITSWDVYYDHRFIDGCYAQTAWDMSSHIAVISFSTDWDNRRPKQYEEVRRLALHEMMHVILAPIVASAEARWGTQEQLNIAEHVAIRQLEQVLIQ